MLYGIGAKALGDTLGVDENDAAVFIQTFKSKYPGKAGSPINNLLFYQDDRWILCDICSAMEMFV
jgi:hypothetical protein